MQKENIKIIFIGRTKELSLDFQCVLLDFMYASGLGAIQDYKKALKYYKASAKNHIRESGHYCHNTGGAIGYYCKYLGDMYYRRLGVKPDYKMTKMYWT